MICFDMDFLTRNEMKVSKRILDHKVKKYLKETTHNKTFRQCIVEVEDILNWPHKNLDNMTNEELNNYDNDLWEASLSYER